MDSLLQLSNVACEAERLSDACSSASCSSTSSSVLSTSSCSAACPEQEEVIVPPAVPMVKDAIPMARSPTSGRKRPCDQILETDRKAIREKIQNALRKRASSYDELLALSVGLAEDQLYYEAPSKLDYYKQGIMLVKKVFDKSTELCAEVDAKQQEAGASIEGTPRLVKRAKTQH